MVGGGYMKKCLIVVDYQNDFIDGSLGFEEAILIQPKIIEKITQYRQNHNDIIFTKDTHDKAYLDTEEGRHLPIDHCIKGTEGHAIEAKVNAMISSSDLVIEKHTFPSLELGIYLREKDYQIVELCGLVSHICVLSNALIAKAALPNTHIVVDALATASYNRIMHDNSLKIMEELHIEVLNYE